MLVEAAWQAVRSSGLLRAFYERVRGRRATQVAAVAVVRKIAVIVWYLLTRGEDYAWVHPALHARKLRDLELRSGQPARRGQRGAGYAYNLTELRQARGARGVWAGASIPRLMYLRIVLRSIPHAREIADTDSPCRCKSRIIINSASRIADTIPAPIAENIDDFPGGPELQQRHGSPKRVGNFQSPVLGSFTSPSTPGLAGARCGVERSVGSPSDRALRRGCPPPSLRCAGRGCTASSPAGGRLLRFGAARVIADALPR